MSKKLFIASSKEGLEYATAVKYNLIEQFKDYNLDIKCVLWTDGEVFRNGESTLASLEAFSEEIYSRGNPPQMGYGVFLLTPDEKATIRGNDFYIARDNVIFEYGLFLGKLGHARTFLLAPPEKLGNQQPDFHMLTDLKGITLQYYKKFRRKATSTQAKEDISKAANEIARNILKIERKYRPEPELKTIEKKPPNKGIISY